MTFPLKIIGNLKSKVPPIPLGAIANWPGGSYIDISGSGYDGTPSASPPTLTTGINGEANGAYDFVSVNSQDIDFGAIAELKNVQQFSISTWHKKALGNQIVLSDQAAPTSGTFIFNSTLQQIFSVVRNGAVTNYTSGVTGLEDTWVNIIIVVDLTQAVQADRFTQYINNTIQGVFTGTAPTVTPNNATSFTMGSSLGTNFSDGQIAQTLVYDRTITVEEVAQIYAQKI